MEQNISVAGSPYFPLSLPATITFIGKPLATREPLVRGLLARRRVCGEFGAVARERLGI